MTQRNNPTEAGASLDSDLPPIVPTCPLFDPEKFTDFAQDIFKKTSLKPFEPKINIYKGIQRILHGATHHARVAMWVRMLANICKAQGLDSNNALSERNIRLLEYVALFHDAGRKKDYGEDLWEEDSAALCQDFLKDHGISIEEAKRFSNLIIKKENAGLFEKILQSADCIDIMRCRRAFHIEKISLYSDLAEKGEEGVEEYLIPLVREAGHLLRLQGDMPADVWVTLHGKKIMAFNKSEDAKNLTRKEKYELAENCYAEVTKDLAHSPWLEDLYKGNVHPSLESEEEKEEEEEENFFHQLEILSYTPRIQESLPLDENLCPKEIYLQKTVSGFAYVFITPDGEVAKGHISHKKIPSYASLSQENCTEIQKEAILQYLLKNEPAVFFQKTLRMDQNIFIDLFLSMMHEEKEEDAEEGLNEITLRREREIEKGIYIVKRGKIYVSDVDVAGKLAFYEADTEGNPTEVKLLPRYTKAQKTGFSKPQSFSIISDQNKIPTQPVFAFSEGSVSPVVVLFPQNATLSHGYFSRYDRVGTVGRPGDFKSYADAKAYLEKKYTGEDPSIRTEQALFMQDLIAGKNAGNYTEVMMRARWIEDTCFFFSQMRPDEEAEKISKRERYIFG